MITSFSHLCSCTVHVDNIKFFICSTNTHNSYKTVKLLKSFKIIIVAPACFSSYKPSSASSQPVLRQIYNVDIGYIYRYLKLSVLWLHILFSPVIRVNRALCRVHNARSTHITGLNKICTRVLITSNNNICNRYQHCNFGEAQAESSLMMVYVN